MLQLLTKVRDEVQKVTHMNNQQKNTRTLSANNVGWEDILDQAKELHQSMNQRKHTLASSMQHQ